MNEERKQIYLQILACPRCKGDLEYREFKSSNNPLLKEVFLCKRCHLFYPLVDDIPNMLPEEAINITDELS